jgi:dipeptidyl aminopeptidase/acylaminoacyl peptidase
MNRNSRFALPGLLSLLFNPLLGYSQENIPYQLPPKDILELADYVRAPAVTMDSKKQVMVLSYYNTYKTLDELNQDEMRLGGIRVNPVTNIASTVTYFNNLKTRKTSDKTELQVQGLPANPKISNYRWSPDESKLAFTHTSESGVELWVLDIARAQATKLTEGRLNANMGAPYSWYKDGEHLLARMITDQRPALINPEESLPAGPIISEGEGEVSQNRTYQDLLSNPTDEANFKTLVKASLWKVSLSGNMEAFMEADMYVEESFSPDGQYLMVTTLSEPFSYIVPWYRFPQKTVVYDLEGNEVAVVNEVPLNEIMPKGFSSVRSGKRNMEWRSDMPAQLYYVEALDGGDMAVEAAMRDELYLWSAPFTAPSQAIARTPQRFRGVIWGDQQHAILMDLWYDTRNTKTYLINPSEPGSAPQLIHDLNYQDIYANPGSFETRKNNYGKDVLAIEDGKCYLMGEGHSKEGQFPFIDELNLESHESKRLYISSLTDKKEDLREIINFEKGEVLVMIQAPNDYPNYYLRNFKSKGKPKQITFFENPFQSLEKVHKEVINYQRNDGVVLSGTLYLPEGYKKNGPTEKLPLLIWAYPREYKDKNTAGQSAQNPNSFTFPYYGSFVYWVRRGYAVLDNAAFPIVGEGEVEPNDNFIEQLVANAEAAIDAVDALGYIDRKRVGIGGHSYGAFMTANLLTHSKLFACGIARSGAYNRSLTPFGFQSEQRNYWDAPEVYHRMSPFMNAHLMKTPLLLTHGEADNNPGTFTLQTERYFQALKNLGAPVRMVILPKESHGYVAKDNIMHLLWEQDRFLEMHLKPETIEN